MSQYLRPILPRSAPDNNSSVEVVGVDNVNARNRPITKVACESCSRSKVKCDRCKKRNIRCEYLRNPLESSFKSLKRKLDEHQNRATIYEELFHFLQTKSESESHEIWRRIRVGSSAEDILRTLHDGDLLLQLSVTPETRRRYDFTFIKGVPKSFLVVENPYLNSPIYRRDNTDGSNDSTNPIQAPYLKPYLAAEMVENCLDNLEPSYWTSVSKDNRLMRKLLQLYFQNEHQWFFILHREIFLEDMASKRHRFCSPLLVNAILAYACHCDPGLLNRAEYWNPENLGYKFLAESKRLWDLEAGKYRLTTIQAAIALCITHNACGADIIGTEYTVQAVRMVRSLKLFDHIDNPAGGNYRIVATITAWSLFMWTTQMSIGFCRPLLVEEPPKMALPDPSTNLDWYGETWLRYPTDQSPTSTYFGHYFRARAIFLTIVLDFCKLSFKEDKVTSRLSHEQVDEIYTRLLQWYSNLESPLRSEKIALPVHLKLHMHYHYVVTILMESKASPESKVKACLPGGIEESTAQIIQRSKIFLQTLVYIYYLRHSFDAIDTFMTHFLSNVAFIAIKALSHNGLTVGRDELVSIALLCAKGLYDQGKGFYLARITFHIVKDSLKLEDLEKLKHYIRIENPKFEEERIRAEEVQSEWPVNLMSTGDDVDSQRLAHLLERYNEMSLKAS